MFLLMVLAVLGFGVLSVASPPKNVRGWADVVANFKATRADGIMSAEGILDDPALFFDAAKTRQGLLLAAAAAAAAAACTGATSAMVEDATAAAAPTSCCEDDGDRFVLSRLPAPPQGTLQLKKPSRLELAAEYLALCERHPVKQRCASETVSIYVGM
jgi:tRNA-dihydrouridine synthase